MQKIFLIGTLLTLCYCHSTKSNGFTIQSKAAILTKLVREYDPDLEYKCYKRNQPYFIGDSLNHLFRILNPNDILNDSIFRKLIIFFLEKKYLYLVHANKGESDVFYVYNASCWGGSHFPYARFALNVFSKLKKEAHHNYEDYNAFGLDLICVNSIVAEATSYYLEDEQHKSIHSECLQHLPARCNDF